MRTLRRPLIALVILGVWVAGCAWSAPATAPTTQPLATPALPAAMSPPATTPTAPPALPDAPATPTTGPTAPGGGGLTPDEVATLDSLELVDGYPLYTMRFTAPYARQEPVRDSGMQRAITARPPGWGCSLFAALADPENLLYGRNFDWEFSPALLLFTDPPDGYASVSMVDIAYLGFAGNRAGTVAELPLDDRRSLLLAPYLPFDGMNEHGLAVGMAAVSPGGMRSDPSKKTIDSLGIIREMLDHARTVDEAVALLEQYNIDMGSGPPLHYLIADRTQRAVLVEFTEGEMVVTPNEEPWHQATNFIVAEALATSATTAGQCWRYDEIAGRLSRAQGTLTAAQAMDVLTAVWQPNTQWSVVYGLSTGDVRVVMGRQGSAVHTFSLAP